MHTSSLWLSCHSKDSSKIFAQNLSKDSSIYMHVGKCHFFFFFFFFKEELNSSEFELTAHMWFLLQHGRKSRRHLIMDTLSGG